MAFSTQCKHVLNRALQPLGVKVDGTAADVAETARLELLSRQGQFERAVFPLPAGFNDERVRETLSFAKGCMAEFDTFIGESRDSVGFDLDNNYFSSPDAELLYAMLKRHGPATVLEVGSGHSTALMRACARALDLNLRIVSVDPRPRAEIEKFADLQHRTGVENVSVEGLADEIGDGGMLFIDSSHIVRPGGDVVFLYLKLLPMLPSGTLVHIHDIFLPFEYPEQWLVDNRWEWNEQYLVQALLTGESRLKVLWPGHYLQRTEPEFERWFPRSRERLATSLWLQTG